MDAKVTPVDTASPRLCAVLIETDSMKLLVMSIYMPVDEHINDIEYDDILNDVNSIYMQYDDYDIVIAGDFNTDIARGNERGHHLRAWSEEVGVVCPAWQPGAPQRPTRYAPDGTHSTLDYIFINVGLMHLTNHYDVQDEGDNPSDHCPISVTMHMQLEASPSINKMQAIGSAQWYKASSENIQNYKLQLNELLTNINVNANVIHCDQLGLCKNESHVQHMQELFMNITSAIHQATAAAIPSRRSRGGRGPVPGWNEAVREARERSLFWHSLWKDAGRPREGWVAQIRRSTRAAYHRAVKNCIHEKDLFVKNKVYNCIKDTDPKNFWSEIKKISKRRIGVPSIIDGKKGVEAGNAFRDKYQKLYHWKHIWVTAYHNK